MKKIIYTIILILGLFTQSHAQNVCCPKFYVQQELPVCDTGKTISPGGGTSGEPHKRCEITACKNASLSYAVYPKLAGFTYTWSVIGGTTATTTGNPINITWGSGTNAEIKVYVTNADGSCRDTVEVSDICLINSPEALFTASASTICLNGSVQFNNNSIGAQMYYWDFGDGNTSTSINPYHTFTTAGTYNVVLTVSSMPNGGGGPVQQDRANCGCKDTFAYTITVKNEAGINIIPGCKQMLCAGDTAEYCTTSTCDTYNWSVTGGTIISAKNGKCIKVKWDGSYPATVTLAGNCGGTCGNSSTINVPVMYPTMPITGKNIVCPGSNGSYSLPTMPGTFYNWSISPAGGGTIIGPDKNVSTINVLWNGTSGSYTIKCIYENPITKCSGTGTIQVNIKPPFAITGDQVICVGAPFTFTGNGNATWAIKPSTGFTPSSFPPGVSISGTWTAVGNYAVTATTTTPTNFCNSTSTINVIVNDTPKLGPIVGPLLICPGGTSVYSITSNLVGMFDWSASVGFSSYSNLGSQADSVSITWNVIGPYKVVVSQDAENGCSSSPKEITVTPYTIPTISGSNTTCMDKTLTYTATGSAGPGGFVWAINNALGTITSGQGTNSINVLWHGSTNPANNTSVVSVANCAGVASLTVTIISAPAFTITGVNPLCTPPGKTLTGSLAGTYTWFLDGISTTFNTQTIIVNTPGVYMAEVLLASGCKAKAYYTVVAEQVPNASISTTGKIIYDCNETINTLFTALPTGAGYCYQWFYTTGLGNIGTILSGATSSTYIATNVGYYYCEVSYCGTGCKDQSDTIKIVTKGCASEPCSVPPPNINVTVSNCNPFTFNATLSPSSPSGSITWYWHDGTSSTGNTVTHQYKNIGTFPVCINWGYTVPNACSKDSCFTVTVPLAANFSVAPNCSTINFSNLSQSVTPGFTSSWSFPGGTPSTSTALNPPPITYTTSGTYTAYLTVTKNGCSVTYQETFKVHNPAVTVNVPSPICALTQAPFTAIGGNSNWQYNWNFGDGYISNLQNSNHAYAEVLVNTNYTVTLLVTDEFGCTFLVTKPITVLPSLKPNIGTDKLICLGDSVKLMLPSSPTYSTYQWYKDGVAIVGATTSSYWASAMGEYSLQVSNGTGCVGLSNKIKVNFKPSPQALIKKMKVVCGLNFQLQNLNQQVGSIYKWKIIAPSGAVTFAPNNTNAAWFTNATVTGAGNYQIELTVSNAEGCVAKDTICVMVAPSFTVSVQSPTGPLCEGKKHTFTASALPVGTYTYQWSNGTNGPVMTTGLPGIYTVSVSSTFGCTKIGYSSFITKRPNVSLFPVGCDTLCLTDTLHFPLPNNSGAYTIQWFDSGVPIGTNSIHLPLAAIGPGDHHFSAAVSFGNGCADTTGSFDLFVKDCTLLPPCDNCPDIFDNSKFELGTIKGNIINGNFTFTSTKPLKEVRINVADLKYHYIDPTCKNCKAEILDRACIYPANASQQVGSLVWDNFSGGTVPTSSSTDCPKTLIFKTGVALPAGTYTIPLQVSFAAAKKDNCKLVIDKFCMHLAITDENCKVCEKNICSTTNTNNESDCECSAGNNWTNLYLTAKTIGAPKPKTLIFCNSSVTGYKFNMPYLLSGMYNCKPGCTVSKTEVVIRNQTGDIIYTNSDATIYETVVFPIKGIYTVNLVAWCGGKKCECKFQIVVDGGVGTLDPPTGTGNDNPPTSTVEPPTNTGTPSTETIAAALEKILPPDFSGGILVAKDNKVLYEKYKGNKVNNRTAFDLASVAKTFTAMAILKLSEEKKLSLNDAVVKYIPNFPYPTITIKMMLSHTSGLEDYVKFLQASDVDKSFTWSNADLLNYIIKNESKVKVANAPAVFNYSNTNFAMLAMVIEKITNQNYGAYLNTKFFAPLGMKDSYVFDKSNAATATPSYYKNGKAYDIKFLDFIYGDKNVYSTVKDMLKWDRALRDGKIFNKETLELAYTPGTKLIADQSNYGLGWRILVVPNGKKIIYHNGWWHGNRSVFIRLLDEDALIVILSNSSFTSISNSRKLADLFGQYKQSGKSLVGF
jgi:CubicO group peptidase (beta-lactamase class C family)/PKD repeat protein